MLSEKRHKHFWEHKRHKKKFRVKTRLTPALFFFPREKTIEKFFVVFALKNFCYVFPPKIFLYCFRKKIKLRSFLISGSQLLSTIFSQFFSEKAWFSRIARCRNVQNVFEKNDGTFGIFWRKTHFPPKSVDWIESFENWKQTFRNYGIYHKSWCLFFRWIRD